MSSTKSFNSEFDKEKPFDRINESLNVNWVNSPNIPETINKKIELEFKKTESVFVSNVFNFEEQSK